MKTYSQKPAEVERKWYVVDAATMPLGKLATVVADKLTGKSKPTYTEMLEKHPERVIEHAVAGMLPKNKLAAGRMQRLHVYAEAEHNHAAQKPIALTAETENK